MAEHLAQRQVGLRDRDVAPQRLRDLVRGPRPLGDQPARSWRARRSCSAKRSSISAAWSVERLAVAGRGRRSTGISRVSRSESHVDQQRARAAAAGLAGARRRAAARSAGWRRCARSGGRRRSARRARASQKIVSDGEWPGRCRTCERAARRTSSSPPSAQRRGRPCALPPQPRNERDTARSAVTTSRGIPWRSISASASSSSRSAWAPKSSTTGASRSSAQTSAPSGRRGCRPARGGRCAGG